MLLGLLILEVPQRSRLFIQFDTLISSPCEVENFKVATSDFGSFRIGSCALPTCDST